MAPVAKAFCVFILDGPSVGLVAIQAFKRGLLFHVQVVLAYLGLAAVAGPEAVFALDPELLVRVMAVMAIKS